MGGKIAIFIVTGGRAPLSLSPSSQKGEMIPTIIIVGAAYTVGTKTQRWGSKTLGARARAHWGALCRFSTPFFSHYADLALRLTAFGSLP